MRLCVNRLKQCGYARRQGLSPFSRKPSPHPRRRDENGDCPDRQKHWNNMIDKTNHIGYMSLHPPTAGARLSAVGGAIRKASGCKCPRLSGAAGGGGLPWPGRLRLRHTCGGGAKGDSPMCPILSVQPGSVEDQGYSAMHCKAWPRGGPAKTRRCTDGMDRGCSAMRGMDAAMLLSESPRGWAGHGDRRWRLTRHDREEHRRARDRNQTS